MLLTDFLTVALIPTLAVNGSSENYDERNSRSLLNSRRLELPPSEEYFGRDSFFQQSGRNSPDLQQVPAPVIVKDPILREIYEEERRLNLNRQNSEDELDIRSEEARELIHFQRRKMKALTNFRRQMGAIIAMTPQRGTHGRSLPFTVEKTEPEQITTTSEIPVVIPSSTEPTPQEDEVSSTLPPNMSRMGIGGVFGKVGGLFGSVKQKIFGGSQTTTTTTTPAPGSVTFPDDDTSYRPSQGGPSPIIFEETAEPLNCSEVQTEYNGKCYHVLRELPCSPGQWLVEDETTGKGKCVENKCAHLKNHAFFGGKCVLVRMGGDHCHKGMTTQIFKNGDVECDCKEQYLFNTRDGNCYPAYLQGPCNSGEIFASKVTERGTLPASCTKSKCSKDGYFCNAPACPNDRNCVALKSKCENGIWDIHPERLVPACIESTVQKIIGNVPTLACAPGSRRDILGTCRKSSRISFS